MTDHEAPRPEQYGWTRDGVALAQMLMVGDDDAASELMGSLLSEPRSLPIVFQAMAGVTAEALQAPQGTDAGVFFTAIRQMLDDGQAEQ